MGRDDSGSGFDSGLNTFFEDQREIFLSGEIDDGMESHLLRILKFLQKGSHKDPVTINLTTTGGSLYTGTAMYDMIRACPYHVTIVGWGEVMSMGAILMQAGDERLLSKSCCVMIHDGTATIPPSGLTNVESWTRRLKVEWTWCEKALLRRIKEKHPKFTLAKLRDMCSVDYFLSATEAVELGLADGIVEEL